MTVDEFLEELALTPRTWRLTNAGRLRSFNDAAIVRARTRGEDVWKFCQCPVTAVAAAKLERVYSTGHFSLAGRHLELVQEDIDSIVVASDGPAVPTWPKRSPLRARLLAACGLPADLPPPEEKA